MRTSTLPAAADTARDGRHAYDHLTPALERLAAIPSGDAERHELREHVIREFRPLVRNLSRRFAPGGNGAEDVEQAGMLGLVKAVDRYDPAAATGGPLGFLVPSIRGEMKRHLRDRSWSVRVPRDLKELAIRVRNTADTLGQQLGRAPRPSELARELGVSTDEVIDALGALDSHHARSLDAHAGAGDGSDSGDDTPLGELIGTDDPGLELAAHRAELHTVIGELPERERTILTMRFFGDHTQSQIATQLGISQMHVSRLLSRTLRRLREQLAEQD
ncbi:RNA polymerase sigma-B factor [Pseudonocardia ammonioxydans]|uniref:RNA polymerase sigma-B factor n=1 Tax=Pseudonocardia ammonioxydans TaxID=260086 RepID=A0A1I5BGF7_PSUAM|nr:SigB/SigF/SigG family RNA polymerase sigma factor [Pseudonocardia ammonioxydans]SFN73762.1 RNA polymerase sigma-B factor [Pseudonocardia ammonioxydans]